jgi:hypothetical protein
METPSEICDARVGLLDLDQRHPIEIGSVGAGIGRSRANPFETKPRKPLVYPGPAPRTAGKLDEIVAVLTVDPAHDLTHESGADTSLTMLILDNQIFDSHLCLTARDSDDDCRCSNQILLAAFALLIHHEIGVLACDIEEAETRRVDLADFEDIFNRQGIWTARSRCVGVEFAEKEADFPPFITGQFRTLLNPNMYRHDMILLLVL